MHYACPHRAAPLVFARNGLRQFIQTIGEYPNRHVLPSRRRFIVCLEAGDADAAVAEMEASLKRLQQTYLSRLK